MNPAVSPLRALKESLRKVAPTALFTPADPGAGLATGFPELDRRLGSGGLPLGLSEIAGAPSSGKTALALSMIANTVGLSAFIDSCHQFYPPAAAALGVDLDRLLVIRPGINQPAGATRAAEILIRSRAFALLLIDMPAATRLARGPSQRLRTAAQQTSTAVAALCTRAGAVEGAGVRLQINATGRGSRSVLVHKGSSSGGPETIEIELDTTRFDDGSALPIAPAIERLAPGNEPPDSAWLRLHDPHAIDLTGRELFVT